MAKPLQGWPVYKNMGKVARIVLLPGWALVLAPLSFGAAQKASPNRHPAPIESAIAKGKTALKARRYHEAFLIGAAITHDAPKRYEGPLISGRAGLGLNKPSQAADAFRMALKAAPPGSRLTIQNLIKEAEALKEALALEAEALSLKLAGDLGSAARTEENAYRLVPSRAALGLKAAELFEAADLLEDARRVLEIVEKQNPASGVQARERLAEIQAKVDLAMKQDDEDRAKRAAKAKAEEETRRAEAQKNAAEKKRLAKEAEQRRIQEEQEAARKAEEDRQRAEREQRIREETDRLNQELSSRRQAVSDAKSKLDDADRRVSAAEQDVRQADSDTDRARSRRDRAKSERDRIQGEIDAAKTDLGKEVLRGQLRSAESEYDDAKGDYDRAKNRLDDARNRLSQAKSDCDSAKQALDRARSDVRDTEDALSRLNNG